MRKLAIAAVSFSVAIFVSHYFIPPEFYFVFTIVSGLLCVPAFFLKGDRRRYLLLIMLAASLGFLVSGIFYNYKTLPAKALSDSELTITAKVTDYPQIYDTYSTVNIKLTGKNTPSFNSVLYCFDENLPELKPGDIVSADVKLKKADERYGKSYSGFNAENIYVLCYLNGEAKVVDRSTFAFLYFPKTLAELIKESSRKVFLQDTAPLMTALLTGDTKLLYSDSVLYAQMSEAGVLHIVAISGMNVAFIIGFIQLVVRRKKLASFIGIPIIILFVPFAGATPSVIRAACMQIMVLIAPLLRRENDGVTSLTAVLAAMLMLNPNACASISLQLSFAATLGIILFTPLIYRPLFKKINSLFGKKNISPFKIIVRKVLLDVSAAFAATAGALVFSVPISALYFGYVSIIGIVVNIALFWAISAGFILGYISCFLGMLWLPLGTIIGTLTSLFARFIIAVVKIASSVPYAAVYTEGKGFGYWLVLLYIIFIFSYVFKQKNGFKLVIPICLIISSLRFLIIITETTAKNDKGSFTALDIGQGQCIVLTSGEATAIIDCGGKAKAGNAGDTAAAYLLGRGRQSIDVLALTHFDNDHVNGVIRLMSRVKVKRLVIPENDANKTVCHDILKIADSCGVEVYIIQEDTAITINEITLKAFPLISQDENALMFLSTIGDFDAMITGDADIDEENKFLECHMLPNTELFIAGHHGSKYSSGVEILSALKAEYAVVSCGYNSYGHPSNDTLERFNRAGMKVFRTDQSGNLHFSIKGEEIQLG